MAARLGKGEDPSAVAQAYGVKPISYPNAASATLGSATTVLAALG